MIAPALLSKQSDEWYTPERYIVAVKEVLGFIGLDPATSYLANKLIDATDYYTIETNGLSATWYGNVWLNPPYSNVKLWVNKLIAEYQSGSIQQAILLVNASTSERWFKPLWDYPICFTDHRIKFGCPGAVKSQPTKGNAFVYFGENSYKFAKVFGQFGTVVRRVAV